MNHYNVMQITDQAEADKLILIEKMEHVKAELQKAGYEVTVTKGVPWFELTASASTKPKSCTYRFDYEILPQFPTVKIIEAINEKLKEAPAEEVEVRIDTGNGVGVSLKTKPADAVTIINGIVSGCEILFDDGLIPFTMTFPKPEAPAWSPNPKLVAAFEKFAEDLHDAIPNRYTKTEAPAKVKVIEVLEGSTISEEEMLDFFNDKMKPEAPAEDYKMPSTEEMLKGIEATILHFLSMSHLIDDVEKYISNFTSLHKNLKALQQLDAKAGDL